MVFLLFIYQVVLVLLTPLYLIARVVRGKPIAGMRQRLGWYPREIRESLVALDRPIWLHVVSVGEAIAAEPLIQKLRPRMPETGWVITTVTPTGQEVARKFIREGKDQLLYLPWDLTPVMRRVIRAIRPRLFLCFETELWPVLFRELHRASVPIAVVNGRISPRAFRRYLLVRPWMERALLPVGLFLVQSAQDARRYAAIGAAKDRIVVAGNVKWDIQNLNGSGGQQSGSLRAALGLASTDVLWTAGSTHSGEERLILRVYKRLQSRYPQLKLLIAPRHPERVSEVESEAAAAGYRSIRRTRLNGAPVAADSVILLDTVGELKSFYQASDLVFVGGSLVPKGGHNLVEPALFQRPIVTGPHLHNFQDIAESLAQAGGMAIVRSPEELEERIQRLIENPALRQDVGRRAYGVIAQNQGAAARSADLIERYVTSLRAERSNLDLKEGLLRRPPTADSSQ